MRKGCRKGQSILEYTLLLAIIIAVIVTVLMGQGGIKGKVKSSYDKIGNALENVTNDLTTNVFK